MPEEKLFVIALSSPSDVPDERKCLEQVVKELNSTVAPLCGTRIDLRKYESHAVPGLHSHGPQAQIDNTLKYGECDLLVVIFWSRFGTPVYDADSGTEHEIKNAVDRWTVSKTPQVMLYFRTDPIPLQNKDDLDQYAKVLEFRNEFGKKGLYKTYSGAGEFEASVRVDIARYIISLRPQYSTEDRARCSALLDHFHSAGVTDVTFLTSGRGMRIEAFQRLRSNATSSMLIMGIGMTNLSSQDLPELTNALDRNLSIRVLMLSPAVFGTNNVSTQNPGSFRCSPDAFDRYFDRENYSEDVIMSRDRLITFISKRRKRSPGAIELRVYDELIPVNLTAIDEKSDSGPRGVIFESCIPYSGARIHCHLDVAVSNGVYKSYLKNIEDLWKRSVCMAKYPVRRRKKT